MAKFPFNLNLAKTVNGDGTVTFTVTITNGNGVVLESGKTATVPASQPISDVLAWAIKLARELVNNNVLAGDVPASVNLALSPMDLVG
jgi:hypothetical protein